MRIGFVGDSLTQGVLGSAYLARIKRAMPEHTLVNLGVGGDTVSSLLRRIQDLPQRQRFDLVVLWVGVNDIVADHRPLVRVTGTLAPQHPARDLAAFRQDYAAALEIVSACAPQVIAVSPLIKGEQADGLLNQRLGAVAEVIAQVAAQYAGVSYLDLRSELLARLVEQPGPDYLGGEPLRVLWDVATARSEAIIDRRAARRGYRYTLDGLHLNSRGADYVAERLLREIGPDHA